MNKIVEYVDDESDVSLNPFIEILFIDAINKYAINK